MQSRRWVSLSLVVFSALPWSVSLGVLGVWLIAQPEGAYFGGNSVVSVSAGVTALCGAQLVFLLSIADRIFPDAHKVMVRSIEGGLGVIFLGSAGVLATASLVGWVQW